MSSDADIKHIYHVVLFYFIIQSYIAKILFYQQEVPYFATPKKSGKFSNVCVNKGEHDSDNQSGRITNANSANYGVNSLKSFLPILALTSMCVVFVAISTVTVIVGLVHLKKRLSEVSSEKRNLLSKHVNPQL